MALPVVTIPTNSPTERIKDAILKINANANKQITDFVIDAGNNNIIVLLTKDGSSLQLNLEDTTLFEDITGLQADYNALEPRVTDLEAIAHVQNTDLGGANNFQIAYGPLSQDPTGDTSIQFNSSDQVIPNPGFLIYRWDAVTPANDQLIWIMNGVEYDLLASGTTPTLQAVTDQGNETDQFIRITNYNDLELAIGNDRITYNNDTDGVTLQLISNLDNPGNFFQQFQSKTGTIALLDDVTSLGLDEVTSVGNETSNTITTGNITVNEVGGGDPVLTLRYNSGDGNGIIVIEDTGEVYINYLRQATLTENRQQTLQDKTGVIALLSDITDAELGAGNGITIDGGNIDLGGTLTEDTFLNGNADIDLSLNLQDSGLFTVYVDNSVDQDIQRMTIGQNTITLVAENQALPIFSNIELSQSQFYLRSNDGGFNTAITGVPGQILLDSSSLTDTSQTQMTIQDGFSSFVQNAGNIQNAQTLLYTNLYRNTLTDNTNNYVLRALWDLDAQTMTWTNSSGTNSTVFALNNDTISLRNNNRITLRDIADTRYIRIGQPDGGIVMKVPNGETISLDTGISGGIINLLSVGGTTNLTANGGGSINFTQDSRIVKINNIDGIQFRNLDRTSDITFQSTRAFTASGTTKIEFNSENNIFRQDSTGTLIRSQSAGDNITVNAVDGNISIASNIYGSFDINSSGLVFTNTVNPDRITIDGKAIDLTGGLLGMVLQHTGSNTWTAVKNNQWTSTLLLNDGNFNTRNYSVYVDSSDGLKTVILPNIPYDCQEITVKDAGLRIATGGAFGAGTNAISIFPGNGTDRIDNLAVSSSTSITVDNKAVVFRYSSVLTTWFIV